MESAIQMNELSEGIWGYDLQLPGDFSVDNFQYTFYLLGMSGDKPELFKWDGQCDTKVENRIGNFQEYLFENIWNGTGIPQQLSGQQNLQQQGVSQRGFQQMQPQVGQQSEGQVQPMQQQQGQQQSQFQGQQMQPQFQGQQIQPQLQGQQIQSQQQDWPREIQTQQNVSPFLWYQPTVQSQPQTSLQQPLQQPIQQSQFQQVPFQQGLKQGFDREQIKPKKMDFDNRSQIPIQQQGIKRREHETIKPNRWDDQARLVTDKLIQNLEKSRNKLDLLDPVSFDDLTSYSDSYSKNSIRDQRKQWVYRYRDLLDSTLNQARNLRLEIYRISPKSQETQQTDNTAPIKGVVYGAVETVGNVASTLGNAVLHPISTTEKVAESAMHTGQSVLNTVEDKLGIAHPTRETRAV